MGWCFVLYFHFYLFLRQGLTYPGLTPKHHVARDDFELLVFQVLGKRGAPPCTGQRGTGQRGTGQQGALPCAERRSLSCDMTVCYAEV